MIRGIKKIAPIRNLKMFKEHNDSWHVVLKKLAHLPSSSDVRKKTSAPPACSAHVIRTVQQLL